MKLWLRSGDTNRTEARRSAWRCHENLIVTKLRRLVAIEEAGVSTTGNNVIFHESAATILIIEATITCLSDRSIEVAKMFKTLPPTLERSNTEYE